MRSLWRRAPDTNTVLRWRAVIESKAAEGEPTIPPAQVPAVKPLKAKKEHEFMKLLKRRA